MDSCLRGVWGLFAAAAAIVAASRLANASYIYIDYHAGPATPNSTPATVWRPELWGWVDLNAGSAGDGVVDPVGNGLNAWRITDAVTAIPNPTYVTSLSDLAVADAAGNGWRLAASARYANDFGTGPNLGLSAYIGDRAYHLMLDFTPAGDLQATLHDETARVHRLAAAESATAVHRFELHNIAGTGLVEFRFDGQTLDSQWDGVAQAHVATVQWGNSDEALTNRGVMDFQEVVFEIGPFIQPSADFDKDGDADGRDFLFWQQTVGSPFDRTADANFDGRVDGADLAAWQASFGQPPRTSAVPEPGSVALALGGVALLAIARRASRHPASPAASARRARSVPRCD